MAFAHRSRVAAFAAAFALVSSAAQADSMPELVHYRFEGTGTAVPNLASAPPVGTTTATIMGAITQTGTDLNTGGDGFSLLGSGNGSNTDYLNTGWATSLSGFVDDLVRLVQHRALGDPLLRLRGPYDRRGGRPLPLFHQRRGACEQLDIARPEHGGRDGRGRGRGSHAPDHVRLRQRAERNPRLSRRRAGHHGGAADGRADHQRCRSVQGDGLPEPARCACRRTGRRLPRLQPCTHASRSGRHRCAPLHRSPRQRGIDRGR